MLKPLEDLESPEAFLGVLFARRSFVFDPTSQFSQQRLLPRPFLDSSRPLVVADSRHYVTLLFWPIEAAYLRVRPCVAPFVRGNWWLAATTCALVTPTHGSYASNITLLQSYQLHRLHMERVAEEMLAMREISGPRTRSSSAFPVQSSAVQSSTVTGSMGQRCVKEERSRGRKTCRCVVCGCGFFNTRFGRSCSLT